MARVIDKLPPRAAPQNRPKYPYDEWFDGRVWVILHGEDYRCSHAGVHSTLRNMAKRRGGCLEMRILFEDRERIGWAFQFFATGQPERNGSRDSHTS